LDVGVLERLLARLEVGLGAFTCCDIRLGHRIAFESSPAAGVHYCLAGKGVLRLNGSKAIKIRKHSFALLPPNVMYTIDATKGEEVAGIPRRRLRAPLFVESVPTIQAGDGACGVITACGDVRFEGIGVPGLFTDMEEPMVEHFDGLRGLREQFIVLLAESARPQFGTRPLTEALLKQCLILTLRRKMKSGTPPLAWMAALAEPGLARVMQAILRRFSEPLSLEQLAFIAGMSRSAFASRFAKAFGRTPMELLRSARLARARELLATSDLPVEQVASHVGFSSRSNFSRTFRAAYRTDPSTFRIESRVSMTNAPSPERR
jgi:AraC family transcriptional regulator, activator of mtrCDE